MYIMTKKSGMICIHRDYSILTDMVYGACTEFAIKLLSPQASEVMDGEGP